MHLGATKSLLVDDLARGHLDERWAGQENHRLVLEMVRGREKEGRVTLTMTT